MPTLNPNGGTWFTTGSRTVTLATTTTGAQMRYTFNGTMPTASYGTLIAGTSGTVSVTPTLEGTILNVIAFKTGWIDSAVHSATFYYEDGEGPEPGPLPEDVPLEELPPAEKRKGVKAYY